MAQQAEQIDFIWDGVDKAGNKIKNRPISALSETIAKADLKRQGFRVIRIKKKPKPLFKETLNKSYAWDKISAACHFR